MSNTYGRKEKSKGDPIAVLYFENGRLSQVKDSKGAPIETSTLPPLHQEMIRRLRTIKLDVDVRMNFFEHMEMNYLLWMCRDLCPQHELKRAVLGDIPGMEENNGKRH